MGALNEFYLWPWMVGREGLPVSAEEIIDETIGCSRALSASLHSEAG